MGEKNDSKMLHIIIPTLGKRIESLDLLIDSLVNTCTNQNTEIIIAYDGDLREMKAGPIKEYYESKVGELSSHYCPPGQQSLINLVERSKENTHGGAAALFGEVVDTIKNENDYCLFLADDVEMIRLGWDQMARDIFEILFKDGIGTIAFDDGINHGQLNGHPWANKKTFDYYGTLKAGYWHYFFDNDLTIFPSWDENFIYVPQIPIMNKHWILTGVPKDETYQSAENKFWNHDKAIWDKRLFIHGARLEVDKNGQQRIIKTR